MQPIRNRVLWLAAMVGSLVTTLSFLTIGPAHASVPYDPPVTTTPSVTTPSAPAGTMTDHTSVWEVVPLILVTVVVTVLGLLAIQWLLRNRRPRAFSES
jgi:hypothetical protein